MLSGGQLVLGLHVQGGNHILGGRLSSNTGFKAISDNFNNRHAHFTAIGPVSRPLGFETVRPALKLSDVYKSIQLLSWSLTYTLIKYP